MSLREINRMRHGFLNFNFRMRSTYRLKAGDILVGEVRRHFDGSKNLKNEINRPFEIEYMGPVMDLADALPFMAKYRVEESDYLEVFFTKVKKLDSEVEIFPGETVEYLDFDPDAKEEDEE